MAISVQFNGSTIYKPGAYSKTTIDVGGGFPLGPAGLIAVIGEADAGAPGSAEVDIRANYFTADQMPVIRAKYQSGAFVDAASFLFAPAADAAIPSGAQSVWFYKTNASIRASKALATSYGTMRAMEWGVGGNRVTIEVSNTSEVAPSITGMAITTALGAGLDNKVIKFAAQGVAPVTVTMSATPGDHDTSVKVAALIDTAISAWGSCTVAATDKLVVAMDPAATAHRNGFARCFEISGADAATFGLAAQLVRASVEPASLITVTQPRDLISEEESLGGNAILAVGHDGTGGVTAATVQVSATSVVLTTVGGASTSTFLKANYKTIKELADEISLLTGWSASVVSSIYNQLSPDALDEIPALGALSAAGLLPALIKKDAVEVAAMFANSILADLIDQAVIGLPDAQTKTALSGGVKGATTNADVVAALDKFTKFHVNFIIPLFSRDAAEDIGDSLTDLESSYTIAGIHQAVKTHISMMKSVKKRSERQAVLSLKDSYTACKEQAGVLADGRCQLVIQDVRQVDAAGNIMWFQPWATAAMVAGARSGASIGEPMTFKYLNVSGIRQTAQPMITAEADIILDFDPDLYADDAITNGITFLEARQTGGYRIVVDNTTYGRDANFVWNRANVIYAADIVAFNFRDQLEAVYVGKKNTVSAADIASTASSILAQFRAQGITVATQDAPAGFKDLQVRMEGNTIYVTVTIKIVEGIDFVLSDITVQRASF
jgi:hypothetical protein